VKTYTHTQYGYNEIVTSGKPVDLIYTPDGLFVVTEWSDPSDEAQWRCTFASTWERVEDEWEYVACAAHGISDISILLRRRL